MNILTILFFVIIIIIAIILYLLKHGHFKIVRLDISKEIQDEAKNSIKENYLKSARR